MATYCSARLLHEALPPWPWLLCWKEAGARAVFPGLRSHDTCLLRETASWRALFETDSDCAVLQCSPGAAEGGSAAQSRWQEPVVPPFHSIAVRPTPVVWTPHSVWSSPLSLCGNVPCPQLHSETVTCPLGIPQSNRVKGRDSMPPHAEGSSSSSPHRREVEPCPLTC